MRSYLREAPWWKLSLILGTYFAAFQLLMNLQDDSLQRALLKALVAGAFFGLILGPYLGRLARRNSAALDGVPKEQRRTVAKATHRGPLPSEPELRGATLRLARDQLRQLDRQRWLAPAVWGSMVALNLWLAVESSPLWVLGALGFAAMWSAGPLMRHRLQDRIRRLSA